MARTYECENGKERKNTMIAFCHCSQFQRMLTFSLSHLFVLSVCQRSTKKNISAAPSMIDCVYVLVCFLPETCFIVRFLIFFHSFLFIRCHTVGSRDESLVPIPIITFTYVFCPSTLLELCSAQLYPSTWTTSVFHNYFREIIYISARMVNGSNMIFKADTLNTQLPVHIAHMI